MFEFLQAVDRGQYDAVMLFVAAVIMMAVSEMKGDE
jgi:hypothetical protein